jgi:hypothetical protein
MIASAETAPIFVHASPRGGSTYFFNVLRRNESLLCFNEAIIDGKHDLARFGVQKKNFAQSKSAQRWNVNHHFLEREDFDEFIQAWDAVMHLCPEFPAFVDYLPSEGRLSSELTNYLTALIGHAQSQGRRPVLCEINLGVALANWRYRSLRSESTNSIGKLSILRCISESSSISRCMTLIGSVGHSIEISRC